MCASSVGSVSLVAAVGTGALALAAGGAACIAAQQRGQYQGIGSDQPVNDDNQQPHAQQAPNQVEMTP